MHDWMHARLTKAVDLIVVTVVVPYDHVRGGNDLGTIQPPQNDTNAWVDGCSIRKGKFDTHISRNSLDVVVSKPTKTQNKREDSV